MTFTTGVSAGGLHNQGTQVSATGRGGLIDAQHPHWLGLVLSKHRISVCHEGGAGPAPGETFGEDRIQAAYGTGRPNVDAACAWPGHWVVAEMSSRQTPRTVAAAASARDLLDHLTKGVVDKARQIDATITAIRDDERQLTGCLPEPRHRRFWPVLIVPDGFPANPLTVRRRHRMVLEAGLLAQQDTARLVVVDAETLEAVESAADRGGPPLPALLADHAASPRADYGFKEWLLMSRPPLRPTSRIADRWHRAFAPALDALQQAAALPMSECGRPRS